MPGDFFKIRIEMELKLQVFPHLSTLFNETKNAQKKLTLYSFSLSWEMLHFSLMPLIET